MLPDISLIETKWASLGDNIGHFISFPDWCFTPDMRMLFLTELNLLPLVPHIWVCESAQHWFRYWLVAYLAPRLYLNKCWIIANWTLRYKLLIKLQSRYKIFIHENVSENIVCEIAAILSRGRWVKQKLEIKLAVLPWFPSCHYAIFVRTMLTLCLYTQPTGVWLSLIVNHMMCMYSRNLIDCKHFGYLLPGAQ